jgi:MFS family permease
LSIERWTLLLGTQAVFTQAVWTGARVIIGYRAIAMGADAAVLGVLASSFALPALVTAVPAGRLADRVGGTALTLVGLIVAAAATLAMLALPGLPSLLLLSTLIGLGQILIMVGQQSVTAQSSSNRTRDSSFATISTAMALGQLVGPPAVLFLATMDSLNENGLPDTGTGLIVCAAATLPAALLHLGLRRTELIRRKTRRANTSRFSESQTHRLSVSHLWRSMTVSAAVLVTIDLMYAYIPLWATEKGIGAPEVGLLLAVRAGVTVASRVGLTWLIEHIGRKALLMTSISVGATALLALPFVGPIGAYVVMIGLGIGLGLPQPLTMAWAVNQAHPSRYGAVLGLRMTANRLGQMSVPLAVGAIAAPLGTLGVFWANAGMLVGAVAVVATSNTELPPPKEKDNPPGPSS